MPYAGTIINDDEKKKNKTLGNVRTYESQTDRKITPHTRAHRFVVGAPFINKNFPKKDFLFLLQKRNIIAERRDSSNDIRLVHFVNEELNRYEVITGQL